MSDGLYLVFSKPPAKIAPEDYDRWYHDHLRGEPGSARVQRRTPLRA